MLDTPVPLRGRLELRGTVARLQRGGPGRRDPEAGLPPAPGDGARSGCWFWRRLLRRGARRRKNPPAWPSEEASEQGAWDPGLQRLLRRLAAWGRCLRGRGKPEHIPLLRLERAQGAV